jgi:hypothetical protein
MQRDTANPIMLPSGPRACREASSDCRDDWRMLFNNMEICTKARRGTCGPGACPPGRNPGWARTQAYKRYINWQHYNAKAVGRPCTFLQGRPEGCGKRHRPIGVIGSSEQAHTVDA